MTSPDLIEKIARAIAVNHGVDPDEEGPGQRHAVEGDNGMATIVVDHMGPLWQLWIGDAEAALSVIISVLKTPSDWRDGLMQCVERETDLSVLPMQPGTDDKALAAIHAVADYIATAKEQKRLVDER